MTLSKLKTADKIDLEDLDLKVTDYESILDVYVNKRGNWLFNLNSRMEVDADDVLADHLVTHDSHWPIVSYDIYATTRLAWLLMQVNHVKPADVFKPVLAGTTVKYLPPEQLRDVVTAMQDNWK